MSKQKVLIIGSGFAGLSAACHMASEECEVAVVEKNQTPGGRARSFQNGGFTFDMGPSWYWMPDVFESFFAHFGKKPSDYFELTRLDPSYRVVFGRDDHWDVPANMEELEAFFDQIEPGSVPKLRKFLEEARFKYEAGIKDLVYKPGQSLLEFADWRLIKSLGRLDIFKSVSEHIRKYFKDPRLIQLLEFPVLFLGAMPEKTPALYSLMNYADMQLGTWYPKGGMHEIIKAMVSLAKERGVKFHFDAKVESVVVSNGSTKGVLIDGQLMEADVVIGGADYHHIETGLLEPEHRSYSPDYWDSRTMAPSSLIFYLGVDRKVDGLLHHNLFFDRPFAQHAREIYSDPAWPSDPLFYVCCPSKTDKLVAPEGSENLFVLVPVAPDLSDGEEVRERYFDQIMDRLESITGTPIREHIVYKRSYAHSDFKQDYNAFKGNAYGLANTLKQTAMLKPGLKSKKVKNLFYTGQLTVPGPGVPPALISGQVVSKEVKRFLNQRI